MKRTRGYLEDRGSGRWLVRVYLGRDALGKKQYVMKVAQGTKRDAQTLLDDLLAKHGRGQLRPATKMNLQEYLDRWLPQHAAINELSEVTVASYRDQIRVHIAPALGAQRLDRLTGATIKVYIKAKLDNGRLSWKSVNYQRQILHRALQDAMREGLIGANPVDAAPMERRKRKQGNGVHGLDQEQARMFLAAAKREASPYFRLYLTAIMTGMRQGELLGLRWSKVDLLMGTAEVSGTLYRLGGVKALGIKAQTLLDHEPKNGRRTVRLPDEVIRELQALKAERNPGPDDLVFCQPNGKPLHAHNIIRRDMKPILKRAKLPAIRFHDLRHTAVTVMLLNGLDPVTVAAQVGASPRVITTTYADVIHGLKDRAAAVMDAIFGRKVEA